jgi:hypothetical protein
MSHTLESAEWVVAPEIRAAEHAPFDAEFEATYGSRPYGPWEADERPLSVVWA